MTDYRAGLREQFLSLVPLGRLGQAEHAAEAVAYLASEKAARVTGATTCVSGGQVIP